MGWSIDKSIIVVSGISDAEKISNEVVCLLYQFERGQEAIGSSSGVTLGILLEGNNPTIEEGNHIVLIKDLSTEIQPLIWFFITLGGGMEKVHNVMESNGSGVRNNLMRMSATSLEDNCFMIELLRDRVNKTDEAGSVLSLKLSSDVSN